MAIPQSVEAAACRTWVEPLARAGYATRGFVYLIIGGFAAFAAFGSSDVKGTKGAFEAIMTQPFGLGLLWLVVAGLIGFAVWRFIQAYFDTDGHEADAKGLAIRAGLAISGLVHLGLAMLAASLVLGWSSDSGGGGGGDPSGRWIAAIYGAGYGRHLTWAASAFVAAVGAVQIWKGYRAGFEPYFRRCPDDIMQLVRPLGRIGLIARGLTFLIIAVLIFYGGLRYRSVEGGSTPGLADALNAVQGYGFGWIGLFLIASGLIAFGLYSLAAARYRRMITW